jgi:hypothetical protein
MPYLGGAISGPPGGTFRGRALQAGCIVVRIFGFVPLFGAFSSAFGVFFLDGKHQ